MITVATLAATLQTLFTTSATLYGRLTGLIRREHQLTAQAFAQVLVYGWIDDPRATLDSLAPALGLSAQALHQRMGPRARAFLEALLNEALRHIHQARRSHCVLLQQFNAVFIDDTTTVTLPAERLSGPALWAVYRSRWQIELLFKRSKQRLGLSFSHGRTGERVLVEVLAKLLGCVVVHWQSLWRGGLLDGVRTMPLLRQVRRYAWRLYERLPEGRLLEPVLEQMRQELGWVRQQPERRKQPSTRQLLNDSELMH